MGNLFKVPNENIMKGVETVNCRAYYNAGTILYSKRKPGLDYGIFLKPRPILVVSAPHMNGSLDKNTETVYYQVVMITSNDHMGSLIPIKLGQRISYINLTQEWFVDKADIDEYTTLYGHIPDPVMEMIKYSKVKLYCPEVYDEEMEKAIQAYKDIFRKVNNEGDIKSNFEPSSEEEKNKVLRSINHPIESKPENAEIVWRDKDSTGSIYTPFGHLNSYFEKESEDKLVPPVKSEPTVVHTEEKKEQPKVVEVVRSTEKKSDFTELTNKEQEEFDGYIESKYRIIRGQREITHSFRSNLTIAEKTSIVFLAAKSKNFSKLARRFEMVPNTLTYHVNRYYMEVKHSGVILPNSVTEFFTNNQTKRSKVSS